MQHRHCVTQLLDVGEHMRAEEYRHVVIAQFCQLLLEQDAGFGVEATHGFIQNQQGLLTQQTRCQTDLLSHTFRQLTDRHAHDLFVQF